MAPHHLIDAYLAELRRALPADVADELADGLTETYDHFRDHGLDPDTAARTALADFGAAPDILNAFAQIAPGRRTARALLATGPLAGGCWALALLTGHAWQGPIPTAARLAFAALLLSVVALLVIAVRIDHPYQRRTPAIAGAGGVLLLDCAAVCTAALLISVPTWPLLLAVTASLTRICGTAPALQRLLRKP